MKSISMAIHKNLNIRAFTANLSVNEDSSNDGGWSD